MFHARTASLLQGTVLGALLGLAAASSLAAGPQAADGKVEPLLAQALAQRVALDQQVLQPRPVADASLLPASRVAVPLTQMQPLAILQPGSNIYKPEHLQERSVCLAQAGGYAGLLQARYGAREVSYPSLAAALAGLRAGQCDALVHDNSVLQALVRLPEWSRYSTSFAVGEPRQLAVVLPASDKAAIAQLRQTASDWQASAYPDSLARQVAHGLSDDVRRNESQTAAR